MSGLLSFLSQPMSAGPQDRMVGRDEASNLFYETPLGQTYSIKPQVSGDVQRKRSLGQGVLDAVLGNGQDPVVNATKQDIGSPIGILGALAEGAMQGVTAPGRALAGESMTMGDVAATALDWGVLGAAGSAPKGALRVGAMRSADDLERAVKDIYPDVDLSIGGGPDRGYRVSKVIVPEASRGQGIGSGVMREIAESADATGSTVALTPSKDFGGSVPRLREFYKREGFIPNKGSNRNFAISEDMYRVPQQPQGITANHDIVRKYGIAGAAAMLGMSAAEVEAAMQQKPQGLLAQGAQ